MHTKKFSTQEELSITVVIPVYNVAPYVEHCVLSVMRQSYPAKECIIVDDASTDDSVDRCQQLIDEYSGPTIFSILHHENNRGLSAVRNSGMDACTTTYIYYLDGDDEMTPDCLEKLIKPIINDDNIEMVMGNVKYDYSMMSGNRYRLEAWLRNKLFYNIKLSSLKLITNNEVRNWYYHGHNLRPNMVWNKLLKLSFLKDNKLYNREGMLYEEGLWTFYLMRCLNQAVIIPDVTYVYFQRNGSIMSATKYEERIRYFGYTFREIAEHIEPGVRIEETLKWLPVFCIYYNDAANDNSDYHYSYHAFRRQLLVSHKHLAASYLLLTNKMTKIWGGRIVMKLLTRFIYRIVKLIRLLF